MFGDTTEEFWYATTDDPLLMLPPQGREQGASVVGAIVTVYACVAVILPFVTDAVNEYVPAVVGIPEIVAVTPKELSVNPGGNVPESICHVNGPVAVPVSLSV